MNTLDKIELPPLPDNEHSYNSGTFAPLWGKAKMQDYALTAIEATLKRFKQELEKWYEEATVEYQKTRDPYHEGKGDAFDIAIQIVERRLKK